MRFRNRTTRPQRAGIRQRNDDRVMEPVEAEVFRAGLPEVATFPDGLELGDSTTPPAQVVNVSASAGLRTILVVWDRLDGLYTVDGAGGYEVQLDTVDTFDSGSERTQRTGATMASFTDLTPDTAYYVRVRAVQGVDNYGTWSDDATATTAEAGTADIAAGAVTTDLLAANAVTAAKLQAITMEVGKYLQSDNYDGTDVDTADATQGFRIEAEGLAEFQDVRIRATELSVDKADADISDVVTLGTADPTDSDGDVDPSPGNRIEFHAIADDDGVGFVQSYWTIDADNGMGPFGTGISLKFDSGIYVGDYVSPPFNVEQTLLELGLTATYGPSIKMGGDEQMDWVGPITPTLTGITLGTGGTNQQWYRKQGKTLQVTGLIVLGTGGATASSASGNYVSIPLSKLAKFATVPGVAQFWDNSADKWYSGGIRAFPASSVMEFIHESASNGRVGTSVPFTFFAGDRIVYNITIPIA